MVDYTGRPITIRPDGPAGVQEGDRLRVDWYMPVLGASVHICLSEPKVYDIYQDWIARIDRELKPRRYLLAMDEIRGGGTCAACKARGMTNGQILSTAINRIDDIVHGVNPQADVLVWADMLSPFENANGRDYWWVPSGFDRSWEELHPELILACWNYETLQQSVRHFAGLGHRVLGAAYYDTDDLEGSRAWLAELRRTPTAYGIMYTTWQGRYDLLAAFGDLVSTAGASGR